MGGETGVSFMNDKYPLALPEGTVLAGQYQIEKVLGEGGFGITYEARDHQNGERVAVKEFFPDTMATRQGLVVVPFGGERGASYDYGKDRFLEEAQTLAQFLGNESIVHIHSYFEENGTAYFVMDFVEGTSFDVYIREHGGKLGWEETTKILVPIMDALGAVHSKGIVHRDVTPDNIFITRDGTVKLLDFGAARYSLGDKSRSLDVVLKHGFAPKEQYTRRGRQGPYTDVYALGATFYYALTGRRPPDSVERIEEDELVPPSALSVEIPRAAEDAILTALSVQPADRFQSMEAFKHAMQSSQEGAANENAPMAWDGRQNVAEAGMQGASVANQTGGGAAFAGGVAAGAMSSQSQMNPQYQQVPQMMGQIPGQPAAGQMVGPSQTIYPSQMMPPQQAGMYGGQTVMQPAPQKKSNAGLIIGIIVAILLLVGGGVAAFFFLSGRDSGDDEERTTHAHQDRDDDTDPANSGGDDTQGGEDDPIGTDPDNDPDPANGTGGGENNTGTVTYQITIFGANTGEALSGAKVKIEDYDTEDEITTLTTDGAGRVNYEGEPGKDYRFYFGADGYLEAAPLVYYLPNAGDSVELLAALVPQISGDDFIVLLEWDGKLDLDLCGYNEGSGEATNYWMPTDSGDKGSGIHFGDHGSDKRFEMIYFHDYSYDEWRDIMVFDQNAIASQSSTSDAWSANVYVSIYNADGLVCVWAADKSRNEVGWYAGRVGFGTRELEDTYISDPNEYTWIY